MNFDHGHVGGVGVLLLNLGTPDQPTPRAVRQYLAEFLSDRRVVDTPRWLWRLILYGIILRIRPGPVAKKYASVWLDEGAPLLVHSRNLTQALGKSLNHQVGGPVTVELAMTYGNPSVAEALEKLRQCGTTRLLVIPCFPQYSATTTAAAFDAVAKALSEVRWIPELRWVGQYGNQPEYIAALDDSVREHWASHGQPERLMMSFHGIPQRYFLSGDPYHCQCHATARLLAESLGLKEGEWEVAFQSRFGREPWLKPYLDNRLEELAGQGVTDVQVICPGFAADCLETLEEIEMENRELFLESGGARFSYVPALNATEPHVKLMAALVSQHAQGWPEFDPAYDAQASESDASARRERAVAMGADA